MARNLPTVLVCHPQNPAIPLRVNLADAEQFQPWQEPPAPESVRGVFASQGWKGLKALAETLGYSKPQGQSWEQSIPELENLWHRTLIN